MGSPAAMPPPSSKSKGNATKRVISAISSHFVSFPIAHSGRHRLNRREAQRFLVIAADRTPDACSTWRLSSGSFMTMIPMPNSGLADPVNWGLGMGLAQVPRSRCARWATGWLAAGPGNKREKHPVSVQSPRQLLSHNDDYGMEKRMSRNYPVFNGQTKLEKAVVLRLRIWRARAEGPGRVARRAIYPRIGTSLKISSRHFLRADVAARPEDIPRRRRSACERVADRASAVEERRSAYRC
jgi:hypothetical protein